MRALAIAVCLLGTGCAAQRELVIDSEPRGALVRLDDTVVGTTPFQTTFEAYGTRRVTLYLDGYRTQTQLFDVKAPWYEHFPLDIVSEVLLPFGWHDRHDLLVRLEPESGGVTMQDVERVLERAESLRLAEPTGPRPVVSKPKPDEQAGTKPPQR